MRLDAWREDLDLPKRIVVPSDFPVYGNIKIDRPITDWHVAKDPLIGLLPKPPKFVRKYKPTVWGRDAYAKSFEKFKYADPDPCIKKNYRREWDFATKAMIWQYGFLKNTHVLDITATVKNVESTPGYPKFKYYKTEGEYLDERGYDDYVRQYNEIKDGERPDVLWYLFLKKEILKEEKITKGDIRQIVCADPIYARIGAMFEQDQNNRMKDMTQWKHGQCGWTPFEGGFDRVLRRLEKPENQYIELDWTRFDGTIPIEILRHIKEIRFSMLDPVYKTDQNKSIYGWYVDQLCKRYVLLPTGEITIQERGNPSGQISTTMDNNMCNTFFQAFEFAYLHKDYGVDKLEFEWKKCDTIVYGDDRISSWPSVPPNYVDDVVQMYKIVFGMWVKPEKIVVRNELNGITFCGFRAMLVDGMYLPVPVDAWKFIESTINPVKALPDFEALVGKILSFQILTHNLPDDDPVKIWFDEAFDALRIHADVNTGEPLPRITRDMREYLWRGGPKKNV